MKALQGGLAGIAGGSGEDHDLVAQAGLLPAGGDQLGQHGQRHVFERGGGTVEQLQHMILTHLDQRRQIIGVEFPGVCLFDQTPHVPVTGEQMAEDLLRHLQGREG